MNDRETKFFEYMTLLGEIFDKKISQVLIEAYYKAMEGIPDELVFRAFEKAIATCHFFPRPSELREFALGRESDACVMAWVLVEKAIRHVGAYDSVKFEDPVIHSIIEAMGGWIKLCSTPEAELKWKRKEFETLYPTMKARTNHPEYLPGIIERDNMALGFHKDIPEPKLIEEKKLTRLSYERKRISQEARRIPSQTLH